MEPIRNKIDGHEQSEGTGRINRDGQQNNLQGDTEKGQLQNTGNSRDISDVDQQEGTMDNGETGGNFDNIGGEENY